MASQQLIEIIIKAVDEASDAAEKVDNSLHKIGDSSSRLSKIPGFDAMKSKLSSVASALDNKLGGSLTKAANHFNNLKNRVTNVASNIRTKMGTALDGVRNKLTNLTNGSKGLASAMGFLKGAVSMTAGMIGFELVSGIVEAGRAAINASSQLDYFGGRLQNASGKTKLSAQEFSKFKTELGELQKEFRKVDMTAVGATVEEMTMKFKLPADKMADLSKMTAVVSSAFVKEGSTQENAILAVSDAMDGQFRRLQEIGITQDTLKKNGWDGNLENQTSLIDAMNKSLDELGFTDTAKDITNLDEAFTALSIAGGQLMQAILVPLTPILIQIVEAVINATDAVKPFIQTLQGAADALPDWLKDAGWAAALALGLYYIGTVIMGTVVPALAAAAVAAIDFAIAMLANPWTYVLLALVAIAYAIYEVGKAFGWWSDVGTMLEAIGAGLQRMWDAFINHPDVQAALTLISEAFTILWEAVQQAGQAVLDFFGINTSGSFDIVWALITRIGQAWNQLKGFLAPVIVSVMNIITAFNQFRTGQMDLPAFIIIVLSQLGQAYNSMFMKIIGYLARFAAQMIQKGISAAVSFVNGIILRLRLLPSLAYQALLLVVRRIVSAGQQWVSNAKSKASSVVSGVYNTLSGLPGKISSALSGVVNAITSPFKSAYDSVVGIVDNIKSKVEEGMDWIGNLGGAAGGPAAGGPLDDNFLSFVGGPSGGSVAAGGYELSDTPSELNINLTHNLENVPDTLSEAAIAELINNSTTSDTFMRAIAESNVFQKYDLRVKSVFVGKSNRARGV